MTIIYGYWLARRVRYHPLSPEYVTMMRMAGHTIYTLRFRQRQRRLM